MQNSTTQNINAQKILPNSTAILVLGILSIAGCWIQGIVGLTLGIIALVLAGKAKQLYNKNPKLYAESSVKNLNAGRICALIGTIISGLYVLLIIAALILLGATLSGLFSACPWENIFNF